MPPCGERTWIWWYEMYHTIHAIQYQLTNVSDMMKGLVPRPMNYTLTNFHRVQLKDLMLEGTVKSAPPHSLGDQIQSDLN